jgi:hypothetical protein
MWPALAVVAALLSPGAARADLVTYSTSSTTPQVTLTVSGLGSQSDVINFTNVGSTNATTPADVTLGRFSWYTTGFVFGGGAPSASFDLKVSQTQPSPGNQSYTGDLTAIFGFGGSFDPTLSFSNTSIQIGNEKYQLETKDSHGNYQTVAANTPIDLGSAGTTFTLYAHLTDPPVAAPEPSTVPIIFACALIGAGAWYRRKRSA